MPGLFHQPVGRRDFLKASVLAGAALVTSGCQTASRSSSSGSNDIRVALLSDTHIPGDRAMDPKRGFDPCENLRRVAADLAATPPRGVIVKGDAASREGLPADYQELKSLYVNKASGLLGHLQRYWFTEYLKSHREKPIVLFVHHTSGIRTAICWMPAGCLKSSVLTARSRPYFMVTRIGGISAKGRAFA